MDRIQGKPIFDADEMLERLGGDEEFLDDVLEVFIDECPKMRAVARRAVAERDAREIERAAHTMKGALLNISAEPAAGIALILETQGRDNDIGGTDETLSALEAALDQLEHEVQSFRARAAIG